MAIKLVGLSPAGEVGEQFIFSGWEWKPTRMICQQVMEDVLDWEPSVAELGKEECVQLATNLAGFIGDTGDSEYKHEQEGVEFVVTREKLEEFIDFLRACGGFESD